MQLHAEIRCLQLTLEHMHDHQISNQRRAHTVRFFMLFRSHNRKQHRIVCVFIVCHFFVVTVMTSEVTCVMTHGSTISSADFLRKAEETKPRQQKLANIIDRLTPA